MDVVIRQDLCDEEKSYIQKRLQVVGDCLHSHGIVCKPDEVPRVALLGSGGGERAHISLLAVLRQLGQDNLLDCFLYMAGVSGSTWAMSSLYADAHWSKNAKVTTSSVLKSISEVEDVAFSEGVQWLRERYEEGDLSLSDVWGVITCMIKGVPLETRTLSDEGSRDRDGANPYPLYSAIDRALFDKDKAKELWFELSPHEAGFTKPGAFVKTSLLKQDFEGGRVKYSPKKKPMDMVQLQGISGSVFGDWKENKEHIKKHIMDLIEYLFPGVLKIVMLLVELLEYNHDMDYYHTVLPRLKSVLREDYGKFSPTLLELDYEMWTGMHDQERKQHMENIFEELIGSVDEWGQEFNKFNNIVTDGLWVIKHILPLFKEWQFGNVANFLYQINDPKVPEEMCKEDTIHLIDAGLFLNSPYPSVLREARDVDIIVSFDFSDDPFQTLKVASDYADKNGHPFPNVDITRSDRKCPKSCYVLGKGKPTVIHIPVFNMGNCKDEVTIEKESYEYRTIQMPYRDETKINHLADLSAENVTMNRGNILKHIEEAVQRRKQQKSLEGTCNYAAANQRAFPKIDFEALNPESDCPKSFYVFEEEGKPTVIHIPLFNIKNCKDEATIQQEWRKYATFQMTYRGKKKIDHLADLAAENVNRDGILKEIRKAAERRKAKH
ncbi:cytosolic phospholipase A2 gamma-like [Alosa pseudoharengus]|uniref:cytosolic phospholipase A2 gamma-like n=1 Tax=Alosa pseudoharengus TaxID=34774 RepID=UPI003F88FDEC